MKYTMSMFSNAEDLKRTVMSDKTLSDMEKLQNVFAVSKTELKERDPQLYYAILGVLDGHKREEPTWELIPDWDKMSLKCCSCGSTQSVKYMVKYSGFELPTCNKCVTKLW